ncbi:MAG: hypothetical protein ACK4RK_14475 [Gemmataceae bacterium]
MPWLVFSKLDDLRHLLAMGIVPAEVLHTPAHVAVEETGRVWLQPLGLLLPVYQARLLRQSVEIHDQPPPVPARLLQCWLELLELQPRVSMPAASVPVLFDVPSHSLLTRIARVIHRLNNAACFAQDWHDNGATRYLLYCVIPPRLTPFQILERHVEDEVRAYLEQAPDVWVEIGYRHALADLIHPPPGHILLLRHPHGGRLAEKKNFAESPQRWAVGARGGGRDVPFHNPLDIPLRLVPGPGSEPAELWVLDDSPFEQIAALARSADEELLGRLSLASAVHADRTVLVLRVSPSDRDLSSRPPPVLVLDARAYRSYLKLPNLFVPCGMNLSPTPRRDVARTLLASDPARLVWLLPAEGGRFELANVPHAAFTPLRGWVHYQLAHPTAKLVPWEASEYWRLEDYTFAEEGGSLARIKQQLGKKPLTPAPRPLRQRVRGWVGWGQQALRTLWQSKPMESTPPAASADESRSATELSSQPPPAQDQKSLPAKPVGLPQRRRFLESRFLTLKGPLDSPERRNLWPELAGVYTTLGHTNDAALCWLNALWSMEQPSALWCWGWLRAEAHETGRRVTEADLERLLALTKPSDVRALAAYVVWAEQQDAPPVSLLRHLGWVRQCLEEHEGLLPVRAVWLAWLSMAKLTQEDVLLLARARDRLLKRLYGHGLSLDHDLPSLLRFADQHANERFQTVREWLVHLPERAQRWIGRLQGEGRDSALTATQAYAGLTIAWGLARLGEISGSHQLVRKADEILAYQDEVHRFLRDAYRQRIDEVVNNKTPIGSFPADMLRRLDTLPEADKYKIKWLMQRSRILEPLTPPDPYEGKVRRRHYDELQNTLLALAQLTDREEIAARVGRLLELAGQDGPLASGRPRILLAGLQAAPRVGEAFALDLLARMPGVWEGPVDHHLTIDLLDHYLFVAGHYDQAAHVQAGVERFHWLLDQPQARAAINASAALGGACFRGLRKLGLQPEMDRLLKHITDVILGGQNWTSLRERPRSQLPLALRGLLHVAAGWFHAGKDEPAEAVLDEARAVLLQGMLPPRDQVPLTRAYIATLGQAPVGLALQRIDELFHRLHRIQDPMSTLNTHFSYTQLEVVEAVVRAVVQEDFTLGSTVRRWLDEDEYLVRRRIHQDMRVWLEKQNPT